MQAAGLTAFHSDKKISEVTVNFGQSSLNRQITVAVPVLAAVDAIRI
jgi:hypothetical protein